METEGWENVPPRRNETATPPNLESVHVSTHPQRSITGSRLNLKPDSFSGKTGAAEQTRNIFLPLHATLKDHSRMDGDQPVLYPYSNLQSTCVDIERTVLKNQNELPHFQHKTQHERLESQQPEDSIVFLARRKPVKSENKNFFFENRDPYTFGTTNDVNFQLEETQVQSDVDEKRSDISGAQHESDPSHRSTELTFGNSSFGDYNSDTESKSPNKNKHRRMNRFRVGPTQTVDRGKAESDYQMKEINQHCYLHPSVANCSNVCNMTKKDGFRCRIEASEPLPVADGGKRPFDPTVENSKLREVEMEKHFAEKTVLTRTAVDGSYVVPNIDISTNNEIRGECRPTSIPSDVHPPRRSLFTDAVKKQPQICPYFESLQKPFTMDSDSNTNTNSKNVLQQQLHVAPIPISQSKTLIKNSNGNDKQVKPTAAKLESAKIHSDDTQTRHQLDISPSFGISSDNIKQPILNAASDIPINSFTSKDSKNSTKKPFTLQSKGIKTLTLHEDYYVKSNNNKKLKKKKYLTSHPTHDEKPVFMSKPDRNVEIYIDSDNNSLPFSSTEIRSDTLLSSHEADECRHVQHPLDNDFHMKHAETCSRCCNCEEPESEIQHSAHYNCCDSFDPHEMTIPVIEKNCDLNNSKKSQNASTLKKSDLPQFIKGTNTEPKTRIKSCKQSDNNKTNENDSNFVPDTILATTNEQGLAISSMQHKNHTSDVLNKKKHKKSKNATKNTENFNNPSVNHHEDANNTINNYNNRASGKPTTSYFRNELETASQQKTKNSVPLHNETTKKHKFIPCDHAGKHHTVDIETEQTLKLDKRSTKNLINSHHDYSSSQKEKKKEPVMIMCRVPATGAALLKKNTPLRAPERRSVIPRKVPKPPTTGFDKDQPKPGGHYFKHLKDLKSISHHSYTTLNTSNCYSSKRVGQYNNNDDDNNYHYDYDDEIEIIEHTNSFENNVKDSYDNNCLHCFCGDCIIEGNIGEIEKEGRHLEHEITDSKETLKSIEEEEEDETLCQSSGNSTASSTELLDTSEPRKRKRSSSLSEESLIAQCACSVLRHDNICKERLKGYYKTHQNSVQKEKPIKKIRLLADTTSTSYYIQHDNETHYPISSSKRLRSSSSSLIQDSEPILETQLQPSIEEKILLSPLPKHNADIKKKMPSSVERENLLKPDNIKNDNISNHNNNNIETSYKMLEHYNNDNKQQHLSQTMFSLNSSYASQDLMLKSNVMSETFSNGESKENISNKTYSRHDSNNDIITSGLIELINRYFAPSTNIERYIDTNENQTCHWIWDVLVDESIYKDAFVELEKKTVFKPCTSFAILYPLEDGSFKLNHMEYLNYITLYLSLIIDCFNTRLEKKIMLEQRKLEKHSVEERKNECHNKSIKSSVFSVKQRASIDRKNQERRVLICFVKEVIRIWIQSCLKKITTKNSSNIQHQTTIKTNTKETLVKNCYHNDNQEKNRMLEYTIAQQAEISLILQKALKISEDLSQRYYTSLTVDNDNSISTKTHILDKPVDLLLCDLQNTLKNKLDFFNKQETILEILCKVDSSHTLFSETEKVLSLFKKSTSSTLDNTAETKKESAIKEQKPQIVPTEVCSDVPNIQKLQHRNSMPQFCRNIMKSIKQKNYTTLTHSVENYLIALSLASQRKVYACNKEKQLLEAHMLEKKVFQWKSILALHTLKSLQRSHEARRRQHYYLSGLLQPFNNNNEDNSIDFNAHKYLCPRCYVPLIPLKPEGYESMYQQQQLTGTPIATSNHGHRISTTFKIKRQSSIVKRKSDKNDDDHNADISYATQRISIDSTNSKNDRRSAYKKKKKRASLEMCLLPGRSSCKIVSNNDYEISEFSGYCSECGTHFNVSNNDTYSVYGDDDESQDRISCKSLSPLMRSSNVDVVDQWVTRRRQTIDPNKMISPKKSKLINNFYCSNNNNTSIENDNDDDDDIKGKLTNEYNHVKRNTMGKPLTGSTTVKDISTTSSSYNCMSNVHSYGPSSAAVRRMSVLSLLSPRINNTMTNNDDNNNTTHHNDLHNNTKKPSYTTTTTTTQYDNYRKNQNHIIYNANNNSNDDILDKETFKQYNNYNDADNQVLLNEGFKENHFIKTHNQIKTLQSILEDKLYNPTLKQEEKNELPEELSVNTSSDQQQQENINSLIENRRRKTWSFATRLRGRPLIETN